MSNENIERLIDKFLELEQSEKNRIRKTKWKRLPSSGRDQWRATPKLDKSWKDGEIPIVIDMQNSIWSRYLNFSLREFYTDPRVFLENYLRIMTERFQLFDDDVYLSKIINIWGGAAYEGSLFGMKCTLSDNADPWLDYTPLICCEDDIDRMPMPEFEKSGMGVDMIRIYEGVKDILGDRFEVCFPEWLRGPFGIAVYLRGFDDFLTDLLAEPEFAQKMLRFATDSYHHWNAQLHRYLGRKPSPVNLYNDEVNCPTISPEVYRNIVQPYDREIGNRNGGLLYWHSCGDVTLLLDDIGALPNIEMMHVGPWTSVDKAAEIFGKKSSLEICVNPQKDIFDVDIDAMIRKINSIITTCRTRDVDGFYIRAGGLGIFGDLDTTLNKIKVWNDAAKHAITQYM